MVQLEEFVNRILEDANIAVPPGTGMEYGVRKGWLESQDITDKSHSLSRKHAARIIHNFLRFERNETDEIDGSPAYVMKDLFDCRVCAGHIIQVYVKGIMEAKTDVAGNVVFLAEEAVSDEEENVLRKRMFHPEKRRRVSSELKNHLTEPEQIPTEQIELLCKEKDTIMVDVRTGREYEQQHIDGAIHVPFLEITKNPYVVSANREKRIICYCEAGIQAAAAARCLLEAGYQNVFFAVYKIN